MENKRKSIKKTVLKLAVPIIAALLIFIAALIYQMNGYKKAMSFYTDSYYAIEQFSADVMDFRMSVRNYTKYGGDYYYSKSEKNIEEAKKSIKVLYEKRFQYEDDVRILIEDAFSHINRINLTLESMKLIEDGEERYDIYNTSISDEIAQISDSISNILKVLLDDGNAQYAIYGTVAMIIQVLLIMCFAAFVALIVLFIMYIERKIVKPIKDISEWTYLFKEGYCGMKDLQYKDNNEIGDLAKSFNIVKAKLAEANALKEEYDQTVLRLKAEEEYKQEFVRKLYDEKRDKEAISSAAKHDGLTGLFNRRTFDNMIADYISKRPEGTEGTLFLIDMDNFKNVNDTLGHLGGDEALKMLAGAMRMVFAGGYIGRYGGDEFIAFMPVYRNDAEITILGENLCRRMDMDFEKSGKSVHISVSVGIATSEGVTEYSELYMKADKALYYAKENGRNQYKLESDLL